MAARTTMKIPDHITTILRNADISGPNKTHLSITEKLDPKTYGECKKVLEMLGGKWNRSAQATIFPKPIKDILAEALDDGEVVNTKNVRQAFYTPDAVADLLVEYACLEGKEAVLEPSAGEGSLVAALGRVHIPYSHITAVDIDRDSLDIMLKKLTGREKDLKVMCMDFLTLTPDPRFDRVIMNPPFSNGQDAKHILHALQYLKPRGILVAIVPKGTTGKRTGPYGELDKALMDADTVFYSEEFDLPDGSFKESGTNINTSILKIIKA